MSKMESIDATFLRLKGNDTLKAENDSLREVNAELLKALKAQEEATEYARALSALAKDGTKLTPLHMEEGRCLIERAQMLRSAAIAKAEGRPL